MKEKKQPLRRCTGCGEMKDKKTLMRVVRGVDDGYSIDRTGKKAGRGAYVCPTQACLARAVKQKGLERSFKAAMPKDIYVRLLDELEVADG